MDEANIHDDLILYISDTLRWIPSKNPALKGLPAWQGLCYHGITLFDSHSSVELNNVFSSWKSLFENAPDIFEIPDKFSECADEPPFKFKRDDLLLQLDKIISFSEKIANDKYSLYHFGI